MTNSYFSKTYAEAKNRFRDAASAVDATVETYTLDAKSDEELAIDVAIIGSDGDPTIVVSSGVHGVEGYFGSAVQLALLNQIRDEGPHPNTRYVLIHSINPYGFHYRRRFNEENIDLNRNFLLAGESYQGAPKEYAVLQDLLNPKSSPSRLEPFALKAIVNIARYGLQPLKQAVAGGQYEYPNGIFFGGHGPSQSARIIDENCERWMGSSQRIVHLDYHTGLGKSGTYKLLLNERATSPNYAWYEETFGAMFIESVGEEEVAYRAAGAFPEWMLDRFRSRDYRVLTVEFGTHNVIRVLGALRAENRAHHYGTPESASYQWAKKQIMEAFCPQSTTWRNQVIAASLNLIKQTANAL